MIGDIKIKMDGKSRSGKVNTIRELISIYAPSNENDTEAYIKSVANYLKVGMDESLTKFSAEQVAEAMVSVESPDSHEVLFGNKKL